MTQTQLELWPEIRLVNDNPTDGFMEYAKRTHGCDDSILPYVERAYAMFGKSEAFDRCKALLSLAGAHKADGYDLRDADMLGIYDPEIDYHVCWDRSWAAGHGVPREIVPRVSACDYRCGNGSHRFYDKEGNEIWRCGECG